MILSDCPLNLNSTEAKKCPCKKRRYNVPPCDLRVVTCEFPQDWRGNLIKNPEAYSKSIKQKNKKQKEPVDMAPAAANKSSTSTEIAVQRQGAIAPSYTYSKIFDMEPEKYVGFVAKVANESKLFGKKTTIDECRAIAVHLYTVREDLIRFASRHHVIEGIPVKSAETQLGDFRLLYGGNHKFYERDNNKVVLELAPQGTKLGENMKFSFTWEEALEEGLPWLPDKLLSERGIKKYNGSEPNPEAMKDNWATPWKRMKMLTARVITDAIGCTCPEVNSGFALQQEENIFQNGVMENVPLEPPTVDKEVIEVEFRKADEEEVVKLKSKKTEVKEEVVDKKDQARQKDEESKELQSEEQKKRSKLIAQLKAVFKEAKSIGCITEAQYRESLLKNYGSDSAKNLSNEQIDKISSNLGVLINKWNSPEEAAKRKSKELDEWASKQVDGEQENKENP